MKILVAGDFCPYYRVAELFERGEFDAVLRGVKPITNQADYSLVNLECPVCYGEEKPIEKCGSNLKCTEKGIEAIKWAGFDCVTLANNHFLDYGQDGVKNTLVACEKYGLNTVGGGNNLNEASWILYKEIGDKKLAVINCCEHEFSIATETTAGSNPLNPISQYYSIKEAKEKADYVLVIVHGGHEHYQLPSTRMQDTYRFFIDAGADAVVNHHQHCYSGYEYYKGKPIMYGLGNFCFDEGLKKTKLWHEGYLVEISFTEVCKIRLYPYSQCAEQATLNLLDENAFANEISEINEIIVDNEKLKSRQEAYYNTANMACRAMFDPVNLRYVKACQRRGWLPFFYSHKYLRTIFNYINCESHRDKVLQNLQKKY